MTTKEKLLRSALKLFVSQGIDGTSTNQISKNTGVASGTPFVHFKTKQDLVDALYLQGKENYMAALGGVVDASASTKENLYHLLEKTADYYLTHYDEFLFSEMVSFPQKVSSHAYKAGQKEIASLYTFLHQGIEAKEIKPMPDTLLHNIVWSMLVGIIHFLQASKKKSIETAHIDLIWDAITLL